MEENTIPSNSDKQKKNARKRKSNNGGRKRAGTSAHF